MRLFIHALGASAGGGLTYLRNVLPHFASHQNLEISILLASETRRQLSLAASPVKIIETRQKFGNSFARFAWEQRNIPDFIRSARADVLLSVGNFAVWRSPVPQVLLSRNSLYISRDFISDLRRRRDYRLLLDTHFKGWLARKSIQRAELTVAPSEAFAREASAWTGRPVMALHHGFDREQFFGDRSPLPLQVESKLAAFGGTLRLLFVSHYNYYRNFETLLRGLALLKSRLSDRSVKLVLTCEFAQGTNPGTYRTNEASTLVRELRIADDIVQLGSVPYASLHHLYRTCDIYVTPAYTETFAHPLVEAMACGLPIVASDLDVHREITAGAALFFDRFSPESLASRVVQLAQSASMQSELRSKGLERSATFSWNDHVAKLLEFAGRLAGGSADQTDARGAS